MLRNIITSRFVALIAAVLVALTFAAGVEASHSWGGYHWARTSNPFTLKLGDNVTAAWDGYLSQTSVDWSVSTVLDTTVVAGTTNSKNCKAVQGTVQVCNSAYGNTGWLGLAQIWISGSHITAGTTKLNDTYFKSGTYNTPGWRQMVTCQEVGHTFGLDHQDEAFNNPNLGTCMDYTNDPMRNDGFGNNLHPNAHDYEELAIIYGHLDSSATIKSTTASRGASALAQSDGFENASDWGKAIGKDAAGRDNEFERDLGNGNKLITHVFWAR